MTSTKRHLGIAAFFVAYAIALAAGHSGCARPAAQAPASPGPKASSGNETKEYRLVGEVTKVEKESGEVTIRHEAIPGFMGAMTMPFHLELRETLDEVKPGDQVEGKLRVKQENGVVQDYELLDLAVTKPALAPPMVLDLSGGSPTLRMRPKRLAIGEDVPDFTMTGQDGKTFKLSELRGQVVALTFIYTRCPLPDFCPYMDRRFSELAQSISSFPERAARVRLLSVSFDPDHDTPDILRKHAQIRGAMPPLWTFAVASHPELERIMAPLGLVYGPGKDEIIHNLCTAVIDPEGKLIRLEIGTKANKWTSSDMLKTLYSHLAGAGN